LSGRYRRGNRKSRVVNDDLCGHVSTGRVYPYTGQLLTSKSTITIFAWPLSARTMSYPVTCCEIEYLRMRTSSQQTSAQQHRENG